MNRMRTPLAEILRQIPAARARAERERNAGRCATTARYDRISGRVILELTNGYLFGFPTSAIPVLNRLSPEELVAVELSPGGSGLHWDTYDTDLDIPGLLMHSIGRAAKFSEFGRLAGSTKSKAKAAAARRNGKKGGRPRKAASR